MSLAVTGDGRFRRFSRILMCDSTVNIDEKTRCTGDMAERRTEVVIVYTGMLPGLSFVNVSKLRLKLIFLLNSISSQLQ
jgi:hypothetical protein